MANAISLTGQKFGRLTVLYRVENLKGNSKDRCAIWHCRCDCGNEINIRSADLKRCHSKSCGCLKKETTIERNRKYNEYVFVDDYIVAKTSIGIEFLIDKDDEWVFKDYYWFINNSGYVCSKSKQVRLHRLIMNCPESSVVDHIDGNPLNNRKNNLRIVTLQQNNMNSAINSNNTSGCTGVDFNKNTNKWRARITLNWEEMHLGYFDNFEDAVVARKAAEEKYFGEYSYDNSRNKQAQDQEVT